VLTGDREPPRVASSAHVQGVAAGLMAARKEALRALLPGALVTHCNDRVLYGAV